MKDWSSSLLHEYKEGRKQLRKMVKGLDDEVPKDKEDIKYINSMNRSMDFVIKWMETGFIPVKENKEVFYDPDFLGQVDEYALIDEKIDRELALERRRNEQSIRSNS